MIKTYNPQSSHTSSSIGAWVNYMGASKEQFEKTRKKVFEDFPSSVIVDGNDDWSAPEYTRPQRFIEGFKIKPLAYYHSGISGITKSGVVLSKEDFEKLSSEFLDKYGRALNSIRSIKIYHNE